MAEPVVKCEGYRRKGGAFTMGPVKWFQCANAAIAWLTVEQEHVAEFPACSECWNEAIEAGMDILSTRPVMKREEADGQAI